ncbi:MAG TPA: hypothetical protein VK550_32090 [Polyangiaceae bacterium]|jgi:hypothetical protein|nr:hypothetical protein [Polyangiaceae bacterium]
MQEPEARRDPALKRILLQALVGDVRLVLQGVGRPTDAEVDQHVYEALGMAGSVRAVLVVTEGREAAGPDARQRQKLARAGLLRIPTAVVTESMLARGVMTAVSWLGGPIKGFAPDHLSTALDFLKVSTPVRARIPAQLEALRAELHGKPPVRSSAPPAVHQPRR